MKILKERLDVVLVLRELVESRQKAQAEIMAGNVLVDDVPASKPGQLVTPEADIRLKDKFPYVSRGALKLLHALEYFRIDVKGLVAIDVGSSTGGFTQVLLERGADKVYAVDSGTNQIDWKLRNDPRVVVMENTNARYIDQLEFEPKPTVATIDVSFISVTKILPALVKILDHKFRIITLIKPQFELIRDKVGDRGLVKKENRQEAIDSVLSFAEQLGLSHTEVVESPITGAKSGNVEYLTVFYKG